MKFLLSRIKEPSTWAGLSMLAAAFGMPVAVIPVIAKVGAAVAAVLAVALPESKSQ